MIKAGKWLMMAGLMAAMSFGAQNAVAQDNGGRGRGNFDPAQMRQRMMERYKDMLEVTSDEEWKAMEPLVQKVMDARLSSMGGMARGAFGPRRPGGEQGAQGGQRRGFMGQENPAADALEKAVEAKASKAELKAAIAKYNEARKAKQAELETAQENLRKVLTARQEALATLNGLL